MVRGIREIYGGGSFAEHKEHPNHIDGYFVSDLRRLSTGEVARQLNLLDAFKVWTWERRHEGHTAAIRKDSGPCGISTAIELYPHYPASAWLRDF